MPVDDRIYRNNIIIRVVAYLFIIDKDLRCEPVQSKPDGCLQVMPPAGLGLNGGQDDGGWMERTHTI